MSTPESIARDAEQEEIYIDRIYAGWWMCDCGCDELCKPHEPKVEISDRTYSLRCLREEHGLVLEGGK